jgi:hypothetical protein
MRRVQALGLVALCVLAVGCGDDGEPSTSAISFHGDAGTEDQTILDLAGLTMTASCKRGNRLSLGAETDSDNAVIGSSFRSKETPSGYSFVLRDFDKSYGAWDPLGKPEPKTTGTLHYARADGGQVTLDFLADDGTIQGACLFAGTATYAP